MRTSAHILALSAAAVCSLSLNAQPASDLDAQWREKVRTGEDHSLSSLRDGLKIAEKFGETDPRLFETEVRLATFCDEDSGCEDQANGYVDRALRIRNKIKPQDSPLASLFMDLGGAAAGLGREKDALAVYRDALDIREKVDGPESQSAAETYAAMARVYQQMKDPAQARRTMQYALEIRERSGKEQTDGFADLLDDSARLYSWAGDKTRSQNNYERAIAIREHIWRRSDPRFVKSLRQTARENSYGKGAGFSETLYRRIVEIQLSAHTEKSDEYYQALMDLAEFLNSHRRFSEAEGTFETAFAVLEKMGRKDADAAFCLEQIARCRMSSGKYREAAEAGEASLQLRAHLENPVEKNTVPSDALLAETYLLVHDGKKSEEHFLAMYGRIKPTDQYLLISTAEKLSKIYEERGDYPQAATKLELELAAIEASDPADGRLPEQELRLARLYQLMGRVQDANRMNMAAMSAMTRTATTYGDRTRLKYLLIGIVAVFVVAPIFGTLIFGILFALFARKMDRKLALLGRPAANGAEVQPAPATAERGLPVAQLGFVAAAESESPALTIHDAPPTIAAITVEAPAAEHPAPVVEAAQPPASQVTLHADGSDLFAMRVLNLLISLLTLGIYSFWGKAKVRRYVCGQAEYQGDWFAFHGTGPELLFGWLRALPALAFILLLPPVLPLFWQRSVAPVVAQWCAILAFLVLWPIARVGAYRYRLNRMSWRAIRFSYRGKARRYLTESVAGWLLNVLTLGLYVPFLQVRLRKLLLNSTYFGDRVFRFPGRGFDLLPAWLFGLPLTVCSFGIGWAWWRALSHRYCWAHTTFAGCHFRCTATGGRLLGLWLGNFFVIVLTLGLGMSWAMLRTLRFWTKHIQLVGEADLTSINQDAGAVSAVGESFADFLGFDFGF